MNLLEPFFNVEIIDRDTQRFTCKLCGWSFESGYYWRENWGMMRDHLTDHLLLNQLSRQLAERGV